MKIHKGRIHLSLSVMCLSAFCCFAGCASGGSNSDSPAGSEAASDTTLIDSSPEIDGGVEAASDTSMEPDTSPLEDVTEVASCEPLSETGPTWQSDVERIFIENCTVCHAEVPLYGAPMSLESYGDLQGNAGSNMDQSMVDSVMERIADGSMPPASQPGMSDADRGKLEEWAMNCGPEGDPSEKKEDVAIKIQVPPPPMDATVIKIRATDFAIPLKDDYYMCFPYTLDLGGDKHVVRFDFELDELEVLHHIVLYGDPDKNGGTEPYNCSGVAADHSNFMFAWAPGGLPLQFPENFGLPIKDGSSVILQIHYNNSKKIENLVDSSGVVLYVDEAQDNEVGMFAPGPLDIKIPAFTEKVVESACPVSEPVTLLMGMPHMHETGTEFEQVILYEDGTEEPIIQIKNWDFYEQPYFQMPFVINPGERLITRCTFNNPNAYPVVQGDKTNDEMCFNFVYHYPPQDSIFCDQPIDLAPQEIDEIPGACVEDLNFPVGSEIEGVLSGGDPDFGDGSAYLTILPEGDWEMTVFDGYLPASLVSDFQVDMEGSSSLARGSMRVEASTEAEQRLILDLDFALLLIAGQGGFFPIEVSYSVNGLTAASEEESGGIVLSSIECEDGIFTMTNLRLEEVEGTLVGTATFVTEVTDLLSKVHYGIHFKPIPKGE